MYKNAKIQANASEFLFLMFRKRQEGSKPGWAKCRLILKMSWPVAKIGYKIVFFKIRGISYLKVVKISSQAEFPISWNKFRFRQVRWLLYKVLNLNDHQNMEVN